MYLNRGISGEYECIFIPQNPLNNDLTEHDMSSFMLCKTLQNMTSKRVGFTNYLFDYFCKYLFKFLFV